MSKSTLDAPNRSIKELSEQHDLGDWIDKNRVAAVAIFVLVVLAVLGIGYFNNIKNKSKEVYNSKIFQFEKTALTEYTKNGDAKSLVSGVKVLHDEIGNYAGLLPVIIKSADALIAHNQKQEALEILQVGKSLSNNDYIQFFVSTRLAVVYEDLGKNTEAIDVLNQLNKSDIKIFEGKNYLDLGRIYLKVNEKEKAKASFQYVVDKAHEDAEFVKMAKLYLARI